MTSEENYKKFRETLAKHYEVLFKTNKDEYAFAAVLSTPEELAVKMTKHLRDGSANKDGEGIKRTCKELGIKQTYKAIQEYLK